MKRVILVVALLIVLLAGGLVVGPSFVDWNKYKPQILAQLQEATGHEYKIDGPLNLAILPYPHVSINKLSVATPTTSGAYELVTLDEASAQLALMPLFSGEVVVSKVLLVKPVFQVAIGANGAKSWMTPTLQQKTANKKEGASGLSELGNVIALNEISVRDGRLTFNDFRSGTKLELTDVNATLQGDSLFGPFSLEGDLVYQGHKAKIKANSGRLDKLAESIAVQLNVGLPDLSSNVSYAGILAFKDYLELKGETGIETNDVAALMAVANVTAPGYAAKKPLKAKGILTLDKDELAYRNLNVAFNGVEGAGYVVLKNFQKEAKGPLDINVSMQVSKPFALETLMPAAKKDAKAKAGLLPQTVTLPKEVQGAVNIKAASVQFGGVTYKDVAFSFESKEKGFGGQVNLVAPGKTAIDINSALDFASQSKSAQNGSVTLSDPTLLLGTKLASEMPLELAAAYSKTTPSRNVVNLLSNKIDMEGQFSVKPKSVTISDSFIKIAETRVNASGSYVPSANGRGLLKVGMSSFGLDVDHWQKKIAGDNNSAAAAPGHPLDVTAVTQNIALPFDLDFSADLQGLRFKGRDYTKMIAKGKLAQSQLTIEGMELTSNGGDTFVVAGGVKDIKTMDGMDLTVQANILDLARMLESFSVDTSRLPNNVGRAEVLAEVKGAPAKLAFTTNLKAMRASLDANGVISDALSAAKVSDLTLRLKHPNYVEMARLYKPDFNSGVAIKKNLDVFASMSRKDNVYSFSELQAVIGPATITGDVIADVSGAKPAITAALKMTDLPVDDLLGIQTSKASSVKAAPLRKDQDVRWSRDPVDTAALHLANIELKATANSISYGNWNFKNAGVNIGLKDGVMDIRQLDGGLYGGHVALTGNLKSSAQPRQPVSFGGDFIVQDVSLEEFVTSFSGSQLLKAKGGISLQGKINTTGASPAALVFDLNGGGTASGKDIVFDGFDLARLSRALAQPSSSFTENFTRLLDASMNGGATKFDTLDGAYTIKEGVIHFDKLDMAGPDANVVTTGNVSLPLWSVDLESTVQLKEPADAPPLRASFKGPLDNPAQTFGRNAMQQYFQKQLEGTVISPLLDKIDETGTLKNLLGVQGGAKQQAPAAQQPAEQQAQPQTDTQSQVAPQTQQQPAQQQPAPKREITKEEAIFGVIQGILGEQ